MAKTAETDADVQAFEELKEVLAEPEKAADDWLPEWGRHVWSADYQEKYRLRETKLKRTERSSGSQ